eukprot:365456-Chlamydomonas_euryale.AAC.14
MGFYSMVMAQCMACASQAARLCCSDARDCAWRYGASLQGLCTSVTVRLLICPPSVHPSYICLYVHPCINFCMCDCTPRMPACGNAQRDGCTKHIHGFFQTYGANARARPQTTHIHTSAPRHTHILTPAPRQPTSTPPPPDTPTSTPPHLDTPTSTPPHPDTPTSTCPPPDTQTHPHPHARPQTPTSTPPNLDTLTSTPLNPDTPTSTPHA